MRFSSDEIGKTIDKLREAEHFARKREKEEQRQKEWEIREQKEREEKERHDAHVREVTCMDLPLDWNNLFDNDIRVQGVHADSIPDALILCLNTLGKVDIEYISSVTGEECKTVILALKGSIYQNPETWNECFYLGWETADEYLSGNLKRKWKAAKEANEQYAGYFQDNLTALESVLPPTILTDEIYITLGSPWIPADIIDDFMLHLFGDPTRGWLYHGTENKQALMNMWKTVHDEITGTWEIPCKTRYNHNIGMKKSYGTERIEALYILEKTLNMKAVAVYDEIICKTNSSGKRRVLNRSETIAAAEKQQKLIRAFQKWVWTDTDRKKRLETIFEERYTCVRRRIYDGSFLDLPGMNPDVRLYPYQKNAVARIIFSSNTLLAHDVGAGKTYVMIAAGQELRRMRLSRKNLYVVPNSLVGQWRQLFSVMYPDAKVLCVEPRTFSPKKRNEMLRRIRDEDFDGIIMAYSCFDQIRLSANSRIEALDAQIAEVTKMLNQGGKATSRLNKRKVMLQKERDLLQVDAKTLNPIEICFDDLGITRLFVDEAHNFKNVPIDTKADTVLGLSTAGSRKCRDMLEKVRFIQRKNDGKGIVFATGTPVTNSVTDAYIMQMYLQSGELALLDLQSFDSWIGMFAERVTEFEIDVDTNSYRLATRFSKFHNLPELTGLLASVADFHRADDSTGIPVFDGYHDSLISKTPEFTAYLKDISSRADDVRNGLVSRTEDNMLLITTDGRKAALDLRLVEKSTPFSTQSKVARCIENVADLWLKTMPEKSTQLIFCDTSTPKAGFNLYTELKEQLTSEGLPETEIAFIHDANTETERERLFEKVRNGDIRILIGSTFKLGLGVNIQDRLVALHHLDVPWRPADMTQREGRILRQGNLNPKVHIFRYITEGSFDAYSWQLLETKQRFITGLLSGSMAERSADDIENTVLDYATVKALAVGNPLVRKRVEVANELAKYRTLQKKLVDTRLRLETELLALPGQIRETEKRITACLSDLAAYDTWKQENPSDRIRMKDETESRKSLRELLDKSVKRYILETKEKKLTDYKGFQIILPARMTAEKPFVYLVRDGKYYVELGDTEKGNLIRIDHFLDSLPEHLDKLKMDLSKLADKETEIKAELAKDENYLGEIEKCKQTVEALDKKLGAIRK